LYIKEYRSNVDIVETNVYYPGFALDKIDQDIVEINPYFTRIFWRIYGPSNATNGMTLPSIGKLIIDAGFDLSSHAIFSWFSIADMISIWRAVGGATEMIERRGNWTLPRPTSVGVGFQPLNIGPILRSMVELQSYKLQDVHRCLCPKSNLIRFHTAKTDTLALEEIMKIMVVEGKRLLGI
jgi:hypothetical protein